MNLRVLCLLATLATHVLSLAQNKISGQVQTPEQEGIYFATVALYLQSDSSLVAGTLTSESGQFEFKGVKEGIYFLKSSMLGYSPVQIEELTIPGDAEKPLTLTLRPEEVVLNTVDITARVPLLEQKADRLVVNVAENSTSLNGNLLEVMKKVPGVLVIGENLTMAGQRNVTILINGKSTQYMDVQSLLKDLPGDNIQRVEVIHQPGAEFDAEGTGAIINIILKKNSLFGTNGRVNVGIAKGEDWKYTSRLSLSHYAGNLNLQGSFGYKDYPYYDEMHLFRKVGDDIYDQVSINPYANQSYDGSLSADWDITSKHRLGFAGTYRDWSSDNVIRNTTDILFADPEMQDLRLLTTNQKDEGYTMATFNPYYRFDIDTSGQRLELDMNWVRIENEGGNTLSSIEVNQGAFFPGQRYLQPGTTDIFTSKLDYTHPFSDQVSLQIGGKYSDARLDNNLMASQEGEPGQWENNPLQSNHFIFDETIYAGYSKLNFNLGKWSGNLGLRYEDSYSEGYSVTLDSTLTRDITQFFPSASLSRELTKVLGASIAYSYRIDRPDYESLNPFVFFLDPFTFERGNPSLTPAFTHSMKFNLTYEKQPFFNVEFKDTKDAMVQVTEQNDETGAANLTVVNLENFRNFNTGLFFPLSFIKGLSGYGGFMANYVEYNSEYLDDSFIRSKWDYSAFLQAEVMLPGEINSTVTGWYNSGPQEGIINVSWLYGVDVGFSKEILKGKGKVSFGIQNLLNRFMYGEIRYANMYTDLFSRWDGPQYNLQFSYKFGNQHYKSREARRSSAAEELDRVNKD